MLKLDVTAQANKYVRKGIVLPPWAGSVKEVLVEFSQRRELVVLAARVSRYYHRKVLCSFHCAILGLHRRPDEEVLTNSCASASGQNDTLIE